MTGKIQEIRIEGNVAFVPLTKGHESVVDAANVPLVAGYKWKALISRGSVYAYRVDTSGLKPRTIRMHRVIMGEPGGLEVDHISGDGLDNRRENLRIATRSQNQHNTRKPAHNTSGLKGVGWAKREGKWRAQIAVDGKGRHLGYFATPEAAHAAYCEASAKLHGEFGRTP